MGLHVRGINEGTPVGRRYRFVELEGLYEEMGHHPIGCETLAVGTKAESSDDSDSSEELSEMQRRRASTKRLRAETRKKEEKVLHLEEEARYHERMADEKRAEIVALREALEEKGKF